MGLRSLNAVALRELTVGKGGWSLAARVYGEYLPKIDLVPGSLQQLTNRTRLNYAIVALHCEADGQLAALVAEQVKARAVVSYAFAANGNPSDLLARLIVAAFRPTASDSRQYEHAVQYGCDNDQFAPLCRLLRSGRPQRGWSRRQLAVIREEARSALYYHEA